VDLKDLNLRLSNDPDLPNAGHEALGLVVLGLRHVWPLHDAVRPAGRVVVPYGR